MRGSKIGARVVEREVQAGEASFAQGGADAGLRRTPTGGRGTQFTGTGIGEADTFGAAIGRIGIDDEKASGLQRFQKARYCGRIGAKPFSERADTDTFAPTQAREQTELAHCQAVRCQTFVIDLRHAPRQPAYLGGGAICHATGDKLRRGNGQRRNHIVSL